MKYLSIVVVMSLGIILTSCSKENAANQEASTAVVKNYLRTMLSFDHAFYNVHRTAQLEENIFSFSANKLEDHCIEVAFEADSTDFFPASLGLDFGSHCQYQKHIFAGQLKATFLDFLTEVNSRYFIEFDAFSVDGYSLGGMYEWKNLGTESTQSNKSEHVISNAAMVGHNDWTATYDAVTTAEQIEGIETFVWSHGKSGWLDNVWEERTSGSFKDEKGDHFQIATISALRKEADCDYPTAGLIKLESISLEDPIQVDFGNGSCDNIITITVGKLSFEVAL